MTLNDISRVKDKSFPKFDYQEDSQKRGKEKVYQIIQELKWTDKLQKLVDYGNVKIFKSFKLRLEIDDEEAATYAY